MSEAAAKMVMGIEGDLQGLATGISTDMHLRNVSAHVQNGLYHAERTPEIDAAAGHLLILAREFGRRHVGMIVGERAKEARDGDLQQMRAAYLSLRDLLRAAKPSAISSALGL